MSPWVQIPPVPPFLIRYIIHMKQTYTLATSEFCGPCAMVKKFLAENSITVGIVNMEDDQTFFVENTIKSVPVLLSSDGSRYTGADAILGHFSAKNVTC